MLLTVQERLMLGNAVLPSTGDFVTLSLVQAFKGELALTDEEVTEFEVKAMPGGGLSWNIEKARDKDVDVGDGMKKIIHDALKALDESKTLTPAHLTLYKKFMLPSVGKE